MDVILNEVHTESQRCLKKHFSPSCDCRAEEHTWGEVGFSGSGFVSTTKNAFLKDPWKIDEAPPHHPHPPVSLSFSLSPALGLVEWLNTHSLRTSEDDPILF